MARSAHGKVILVSVLTRWSSFALAISSHCPSARAIGDPASNWKLAKENRFRHALAS